MAIEIRACLFEDFEQVAKLLQQLWPERIFDINSLRRTYDLAIASANQKLIVGIVDGKVVGFCSLTIKNNLWAVGNVGSVDELVVDAEYRGKGIGKRLMDEICRIATDNNCKRIELESSFHRKDAHVFYQNIGYKSRAFWFTKTLEN